MNGSDVTFHNVIEFESQLSEFIACSDLSAHDAIVAVGICLARVLYGLEQLYGKDSAVEACQLLDQTMVKAWDDFMEKSNTVH